MDRTLYRLPALLLDDYADLTPLVLKQAYVEALCRADDVSFYSNHESAVTRFVTTLLLNTYFYFSMASSGNMSE